MPRPDSGVDPEMNTLVTGGGGFVGRRIVELLLEQGHSVSILARGRYPEVEALGATGIQADLSDPEAVAAAVEGMDAVFDNVHVVFERWFLACSSVSIVTDEQLNNVSKKNKLTIKYISFFAIFRL